MLLGSLTSAALATVVLRIRNAHHRRITAAEAVDADGDGVPDVYEDDPGR